MELMDLIFAIIENFVPINKSQLAALKGDALTWRGMIDKKERDEPASLSKVEALYIKVHKNWWWKLAFAVAYLPLANWITRMNSSDYFDPTKDLDGRER